MLQPVIVREGASRKHVDVGGNERMDCNDSRSPLGRATALCWQVLAFENDLLNVEAGGMEGDSILANCRRRADI